MIPNVTFSSYFSPSHFHITSNVFFIMLWTFLILQQPTGQQHQTLIIEEFEPDVFRQLIEYIHTGQVCLQPRTLLGVMNASDYYGLEELRRACSGFVQCCITVDTVCALLSSAERYIQYKCTKSLVQKVLEFVDEHGNEVLNLGSFTLLPQHVVRLILTREELQADEFTKFQAALMWSKKYCDTNPVSFWELVSGLLVKCVMFGRNVKNNFNYLTCFLNGFAYWKQKYLSFFIHFQFVDATEGGYWQLFRVHPISQDPCERFNARGSPAWGCSLFYHYERVGVSGWSRFCWSC